MTFRCSLVDLSALPPFPRARAIGAVERSVCGTPFHVTMATPGGGLFALLSLEVPDAGAS